ncbi:MAG TPA: prenyltransferase [Methylophilaceae bacterium]|nr:prenyltransferase [Methylophilaceae bacterium]HQR60570.1 prenyltransferase [Methylophilaceae bacterium]
MKAAAVTLEPTPERYANPVARYFAATRPPFLSATLVACLLGLAIAAYSGIAIDKATALITALLALLVHAAVNVLNDYYDALNGTDDANTQRVFPFTGGSRFIQNGVLTPSQTACFGYALLALSVLGGLWLAWQSGEGLFALGVAGLLIGWAYSAAPLRLNSRGLGELCVLAGFLGVVVGADYVQRHTFSAQPWLVGLPYALLVTNLLYINQFPDRVADSAAGKRHWVVRLPLPVAARIYPLLVGLALGMLLALAQRGLIPDIALASGLPMLLSFKAAAILRRHTAQPAELLPAIRLTIAAMLAHGILLAILLWWGAA